MTNNDLLNQLRVRRGRIQELMAIQKLNDAVELLRAESFYVDAIIYYRERHGGMDGVVLELPLKTGGKITSKVS